MREKIINFFKFWFTKIRATPEAVQLSDHPAIKPPPDKYTGSLKYYYDLYSTCQLSQSPVQKSKIAWALDKALKGKPRYEVVELATGVPWYLIAGIHCRESSSNWMCNLVNGEPLDQVTKLVPKGLGPWNTWEESAIDALTMQIHKQLDGEKIRWTLEECLQFAEKYNGLGYLKYHPETKTPYLWACTNWYLKGKYVADGRYMPEAISDGVGVAAVIKALQEQNQIHLQFSEKGLLA